MWEIGAPSPDEKPSKLEQKTMQAPSPAPESLRVTAPAHGLVLLPTLGILGQEPEGSFSPLPAAASC